MTIYAMQLPAGHERRLLQQGPGRLHRHARGVRRYLADLGFDAVFDQATLSRAAAEPERFEARAAALARHGAEARLAIRQQRQPARRSSTRRSPFFAHTLPEWHAPLYRSLSLAAQRFARLPNFLGLLRRREQRRLRRRLDPAPPTPGSAVGRGDDRIPRQAAADGAAPAAGRAAASCPSNTWRRTRAEFLKYVQRYDAAFSSTSTLRRRCGRSAPRLVFTTSAFGSSPGPGARGGWPWASAARARHVQGLECACRPTTGIRRTPRSRCTTWRSPTASAATGTRSRRGRCSTTTSSSTGARAISAPARWR